MTELVRVAIRPSYVDDCFYACEPNDSDRRIAEVAPETLARWEAAWEAWGEAQREMYAALGINPDSYGF